MSRGSAPAPSARPSTASAAAGYNYSTGAAREQTAAAVRWLRASPAFTDYAAASRQSDQFRLCFWLGLVACAVCIYLDIMLWLVESPTGRFRAYRTNRDAPAAGATSAPVLGALIRSSGSLALSVVMAGIASLFVLPWCAMGTWAAADRDPSEYSFADLASSCVNAFVLLQWTAPYANVSLEVPPFLHDLSGGSWIKRGLAGCIVPVVVCYVMFYRRFCVFWKNKAVVSQPCLLYAPQLGLAMVACWWFVGTAVDASSIDEALKSVADRETNMQILVRAVRGSAEARAAVTEFCAKLYSVVLPYSVCILASATTTVLSDLVKALSPSSHVTWALALIAHCAVGCFLFVNGALTRDLSIALGSGIVFLLCRGFPVEREDDD